MRIHPDNVRLERNSLGIVAIADAEGMHLGALPARFSNMDAYAAVHLANTWYDAGFEEGRRQALAEIRAALGIER